MKTKVHAGLYRTSVKAGQFTVRNTGSKSWVVLNAANRRVGKFPSLSEATRWLEGLTHTPSTASPKSVRYLRDLLAENQGTELAEKIRAYLNSEQATGRAVTQADVSLAIRRLLNPGRALTAIPAQRLMTKAEALTSIRATLAKAGC